MDNLINYAEKTMLDFAERTCIGKGDCTPVRYLWTDAFAVCNFWALWQKTEDVRYRELAITLVDQVHAVLGRHRSDDHRSGWISGLEQEEGRAHPTAGGLRIGKPLPERSKDAPYDEQLEWEREGQYYHYLTKWMLALLRSYQMTQNESYLKWAAELAHTAYEHFTYQTAYGIRRMYWKMSTDLSYPLVTSMGQHDALDGYVVYRLLEEALDQAGISELTLQKEIEGLWQMLGSMQMATQDALGIGGLLSDAALLSSLHSQATQRERTLIEEMLHYSATGIGTLLQSGLFEQPATYRLAFRELGLAIGLEGIWFADSSIKKVTADERILNILTELRGFGIEIRNYWMDTTHQQTRSWQAHRDINEVMLATSLIPEGLFGLER